MSDSEYLEKKEELLRLKKESFENRDQYWSAIAEKLVWTKPWHTVCDLSDAPLTKWFAGGELNMCYNSVDRHIKAGYGDREAFTFDSPVTKTKITYTYIQVYEQVIRLAGILRDAGVKKGDRIMVYTPMLLEGILAMLASCRIGATHCAMPSGLPAQDLAIRIDHAKPKVIFTASHGYHANGWVNYKDILDKACLKATHKPSTVVVLKRQDNINMVTGRDLDWVMTVKMTEPFFECVPMEANDPLFVIYTSGSTGNPKGVVHGIGQFAVKVTGDLYILTGHTGYESDQEVYYMTSNIGWIAGHTNLIYSPLLSANKAIIYEGDPLLTSDVNALYKLIEHNAVTMIALRPGVIKILKSMDPDGKVASQYDLSSIKQMHYGGERLDQGTSEWASKTFNTTMWNVYAQTELSSFVTGPLNCPRSNAIFNASIPYPGYDITILKHDKTVAKANETGRILIKLPLSPGGLVSLLEDHDKCGPLYFEEFPGYFDTKDEGYFDENGCLAITGRMDNIMKHALIYLAAPAVEEIVFSHPDVAECVVISIPDLILKEIPATLYTVKKGTKKPLDQISREILEIVSNHFKEAVTFGKVIPVNDLPRTRTGKIHRPTLETIRRGKRPVSTGILENPDVLEDIAKALDQAGYVQ